MEREVVVLLRELRPDEGLGETMDQMAALVHHAYLFWAAGAVTIPVATGRGWPELLGDRPRSTAPTPRTSPAYYAQFPERRIWASVIENEAPEPLDGFFVSRAPGGELRVLGIFGLQPERVGFSAVEATGAAARRARAGGRHAAVRLRRWPAARRRGCARIVGEEELLELGWRTQGLAAGVASGGADGNPEGLHGQEGRGRRAGADRLLPRAARREPVSHPRLPHRRPRRRAASRRSAPRPRGRRRSPRPRASGPATLQIVTELVATGRASMLEELREQIPPGLVEMLAISGLGVAKIRQIHDVLGIDSLPELEAAAHDGRLAKLPRFGQKTSENILKGIAYLRQASTYRLSHHAAEEAEGLRAALEQLPGVTAAIVAGDVRRRIEVVRDLVLVLVADVPPAELFKRLSQSPGRARVRGPGRAPAHPALRRRRQRADRGHHAGQRGRGAGAGHGQRGATCAELAAYAAARGFALNGAALWRGSEFVADARRGALLPRARPAVHPAGAARGHGARSRPPRVASCRGCWSTRDLRGFLHCHTNYSDGSNSVEELALACRARRLPVRRASPITVRPPRTRAGSSPTTCSGSRTRSTRSTPGSRASACSRAWRPTSCGRPHRLRGPGPRAARLRDRVDPQPVQHERAAR